MNRTFILIIFQIITLNCFSQYPEVIDSILFKSIRNNEVLIIDNQISERKEFFFNDNQKIIKENYYGLSECNDSIELFFVESTNKINGEMTNIQYTYDIQTLNIKKIDTFSITSKIQNKIEISDSIFWTYNNGNLVQNFVLVSKNNQFTFYKETLLLTRVKFISEWQINYFDDKVFLFDLNHSTAYIIFYKNKIPFKIEKYYSNLNLKDLNIQETFINNFKKKDPILTYYIYYGEIKKQPKNKIISKRTNSVLND